MFRSQKGFSVTEFLVGSVIVGIGIAIAFSLLLDGAHREENEETLANMHIVQMACEEYAIENGGSYTFNTPALMKLVPDGTKNQWAVRGIRVVYCYRNVLDCGTLDPGTIVLSEKADSTGVIDPSGYTLRGVSWDGRFLQQILESTPRDNDFRWPKGMSML